MHLDWKNRNSALTGTRWCTAGMRLSLGGYKPGNAFLAYNGCRCMAFFTQIYLVDCLVAGALHHASSQPHPEPHSQPPAMAPSLHLPSILMHTHRHAQALLGPSGAGKSTLMDILAQRKSTGNLGGSMLVDGMPATGSYIRRTAYVPQNDNFVPVMTTVEVGGTTYGAPRRSWPGWAARCLLQLLHMGCGSLPWLHAPDLGTDLHSCAQLEPPCTCTSVCAFLTAMIAGDAVLRGHHPAA
jgi:hypothetical protein